MTQQQVANALNIDRSTYTYYETGNTEPSVDRILKLARIFNVPYTALIRLFDDSLGEPENNGGGFRADSFESNWGVAHDSFYPHRGGFIDPYAYDKIYDIAGDERQLLAIYRVLTSDSKKELLKMAEDLNASNKGDK